MKDVDATLDKYKGREKELFRRLKLKYQAPDNILVESEFWADRRKPCTIPRVTRFI